MFTAELTNKMKIAKYLSINYKSRFHDAITRNDIKIVVGDINTKICIHRIQNGNRETQSA